MARRALVSEVPQDGIATPELQQITEAWLMHAQYAQLSENTIAARRVFLKNLIWFLNLRNFPCCSCTELRQFFLYLANGHTEPGGRWGNPQLTKALQPISVKDYHVCLKSLFGWSTNELQTAYSRKTISDLWIKESRLFSECHSDGFTRSLLPRSHGNGAIRDRHVNPKAGHISCRSEK